MQVPTAYPELFGKPCWVVLNRAHPDSSTLVDTAISVLLLSSAKRNNINVLKLHVLVTLRPHPLVAGPLYEATPLTTPPVETGTILVVRNIPAVQVCECV